MGGGWVPFLLPTPRIFFKCQLLYALPKTLLLLLFYAVWWLLEHAFSLPPHTHNTTLSLLVAAPTRHSSSPLP
ncbi:hypothetical protein VIGAN_03041000 [Vigna angularis var. angularis]|uniref:Uncharacterized protein n=1 Tax=Vigna angularis var. angularis TaxID=157739 RepID=A0A0S3RJN9_PHAAN|nr:hypothetical protein VIGAN_03041000 [Vigna angularis var. angularis]